MNEKAIMTRDQAGSINMADGIFMDVRAFEHAQRVAKIFTSSGMVPEHFRGEKNIGNCLIAMNLAFRHGLDPVMVMQKMYVIHGKPGIEAQLAIGLIAGSGRFGPLKYNLSGSGDKRQCYISAKRISDGETVDGPVVSIQTAKDDGWYAKSGSKWKTLPDLMLSYRAATFFGRLHCPDALMGMNTKEELVEMGPDGDGVYVVPDETQEIVIGDEPTTVSEMMAGNENKVESQEVTEDQVQTKKDPLIDGGIPG